MNYIYILEALLLLISIIGGFVVTIKYLVRFQRRIDRLLILNGINTERIGDVEKFLEKKTDFRAKRNLAETSIPEFDTDFI